MLVTKSENDNKTTTPLETLALAKSELAKDYVSGLVAVHAYRTLASGFVCASSGPAGSQNEKIVRCTKRGKEFNPMKPEGNAANAGNAGLTHVSNANAP